MATMANGRVSPGGVTVKHLYLVDILFGTIGGKTKINKIGDLKKYSFEEIQLHNMQ